MTATEMKSWMEQWKGAASALEEFRKEELSHLDEDKNASIAASFFLVKSAEKYPARDTSGLVEQQAIFHRLPRR